MALPKMASVSMYSSLTVVARKYKYVSYLSPRGSLHAPESAPALPEALPRLVYVFSTNSFATASSR